LYGAVRGRSTRTKRPSSARFSRVRTDFLRLSKMGRTAYWKGEADSLASRPLGDANRGAFLALQSAVSTGKGPSPPTPPSDGSFPFSGGLDGSSGDAADLLLPWPPVVKRVLLASPRGYCAGVERAVETVEKALELYGRPVYVRKQIVHNAHVVRELEARGAIFVDDERDAPEGATLVLSAHGVEPAVFERAAARRQSTIDATCPLVTKVHVQARRYAAEGCRIVLIGHAGHPEVEGTMGQVPGPVLLVQNVDDVAVLPLPTDAPVAYITQTTLSVDDTKDIIAALQAKFTDIQGPDIRDICYATQNRQSAVRDLSKLVDVILVVGAANSSNSNRLREIGTEVGVASYLIADGSALNPEWLKDAKAVGITAGASAPEVLVDDVIEALRRIGPVTVSVLPGREENIEFRLPAELTAG